MNHLVCIAPMLKLTDTHYRYLIRIMSKHVFLYTEMITTDAILYGHKRSFLTFNEEEHPIALQLGGNNPQQLARCATIAEIYGYDEINLNIGCPSQRVQAGQFGAALLLKPQLVKDCLNAIRDTVTLPVSIKIRIGLDSIPSYCNLSHFVELLDLHPNDTLIVHARSAYLDQFSPKENRNIPPLNYAFVYQLKKEYPHLNIILNGGIHSVSMIKEQLSCVDGVMIGRAAYDHPYFLSFLDTLIFEEQVSPKSRFHIIETYLPYIQKQLIQGIPLKRMARHLLNLFHGEPGSKLYRRYLSEHMHNPNAGLEVIQQALSYVIPQM